MKESVIENEGMWWKWTENMSELWWEKKTLSRHLINDIWGSGINEQANDKSEQSHVGLLVSVKWSRGREKKEWWQVKENEGKMMGKEGK